MRHVALVSACRKVFLKMGKRGHRAAMIEGVDLIGHQSERIAFPLQYTVKLLERTQWIRHMLQDVRRQQEVLRAVCNGTQLSRIVDVLFARIFSRKLTKRTSAFST